MDKRVRILECMPERTPIGGTFELTIRCNLHCKMCLFRRDDSESAELMANELTTEQWIDLAKQTAEAGTFNLLITGGEPMLRSDFCEIWEGIYKCGFIITLYTNATLVTPRILQTLSKYPPHRIGITIYGASPETYERVTGSAKAFELMCKGVTELQSLPSEIEYRMTIIKENLSEYADIESLVSKLSGKSGQVTMTRMVTSAVRGGCADVKSCRISPEDNIRVIVERSKNRLVSTIKETGLAITAFDVGLTKEIDCKKSNEGTSPSLLGCDAGMNSFAITYDGNLIPCQLLDAFSVDLKNISFVEAWHILPTKIKKYELCEKCQNCEYIEYCLSCLASRYAESGEFGGASDYFCQDVQERLKYNGKTITL